MLSSRLRSLRRRKPDAEPPELSWRWPDELTTEALNRIGTVALDLFLEAPRWVHRRVECLSLRDESAARHHISIDFTVPDGIPPAASYGDEPLYIVPLCMLTKLHPKPLVDRHGQPLPMAPYAGIDFVDSSGGSVPLFTRRQAANIAATSLVQFAERLAPGCTSHRTLFDYLMDVVLSDDDSALEALSYVFVAGPATRSCSLLREHRPFREMAHALANRSLVFCAFRGRPPGRAVVKLSYDESLRFRPRSRLRRSFGLKTEHVSFEVCEIGSCGGHHIEIDVPPELECTEVGLVGTTYELDAKAGAKPTKHRTNYYVRQVDYTRHGHIHLVDPTWRRTGQVWVKLRARRAGFLTNALVASAVTTVVMAPFAFFVDELADAGKSEAAITTLLLVPALISVYVAQPGIHAVTARMLRFSRLSLVVNGMLPVIAGLALLVDSGPCDWLSLHVVWPALAVVALLFTGVFALSWILPRKHGRSAFHMPE